VSELRPLAGRARWATIALAAVILVDLAAIWSDWLEIDLMNRVIDGEDVPLEDLEASDDRQAVVGILQFLLLVITAFFFIRWFHAAYSNLRALGQTDLRYGTGWAIGAWFVPILNLWRPKQIANDIWRGSDPNAAPLTKASWDDIGVPLFLGAWWAAWIVSGILGNIVGRLWLSTETAEDLRTAATVDIVTSIVSIVAAVLAIVVVRRLTARQEERTRRVAVDAAAAGTMPVA
jgi:hypothetical protein